MTEKEARNETLWNTIPMDIRNRIEDVICDIDYFLDMMYKISKVPKSRLSK